MGQMALTFIQTIPIFWETGEYSNNPEIRTYVLSYNNPHFKVRTYAHIVCVYVRTYVCSVGG